MQIVSSEVVLSSQRTYIAQEQIHERVRYRALPDAEGHRDNHHYGRKIGHGRRGDRVSLSAEGKQKSRELAVAKLAEALDPGTQSNELRLAVLQAVIERFTGRRVETVDVGQRGSGSDLPDASEREAAASVAAQPSELRYDYYTRRVEAERVSFSAEGVVRTADGQEIDISVALNASRALVQEESLKGRYRDGKIADELIVDYQGVSASVTETQFNFDIDLAKDSGASSVVATHSGLLAIDANGDGAVDTGSELLGTDNGDGLAELAAHDEDGNLWIDAGDTIFGSLSLFARDADGNGRLLTLGEAGIGAIYLGSVATQFDILSAGGEAAARVQSSGIYLNEDGSVGSLQTIDVHA